MLTTNEAAAALKLTRRRVLALIEAGRLKAEKHGRDWIVDLISLDELKQARRLPGRPRKERTVYTYRVTVNERDLTNIQTYIAYDHVGFDADGNEIIEISTERDVSAQLDRDPAVVRYEMV